MDTDRIEGKLKEGEGKLTGDEGREAEGKAQGAWGEIVHDLRLRQEIVRLRGRKRLDGAIDHDFLQRYVDSKLVEAKRSRRAASEVAHTIRTLAAAPISASALSPAKEAAATPPPGAATPAPTHIEPLQLSIGTGYVGSL